MTDSPYTFEELEERYNVRRAALQLRASRPWAYDIAFALPRDGSSLDWPEIYRRVANLRSDTDLPTPKAFEATVRSAMNSYRDKLFCSPTRGKWALLVRQATVWIAEHEAEFLTPEGPKS